MKRTKSRPTLIFKVLLLLTIFYQIPYGNLTVSAAIMLWNTLYCFLLADCERTVCSSPATSEILIWKDQFWLHSHQVWLLNAGLKFLFSFSPFSFKKSKTTNFHLAPLVCAIPSTTAHVYLNPRFKNPVLRCAKTTVARTLLRKGCTLANS